MEGKKKFSFANFRVPHTYVLLFSIIICAVLTHVIPTCEYDRYENASGSTVAGATMGITNESLVFVPIGIMVARKVKADPRSSIVYDLELESGKAELGFDGKSIINPGRSRPSTRCTPPPKRTSTRPGRWSGPLRRPTGRAPASSP